MVEKLLKELVGVKLPRPEDFLVIKETLTRIGTTIGNTKALIQECHILHKRGEYFIVHYNQLKQLDGMNVTFDLDDMAVLNTIIVLLEDWNLIEVVDPKKIRFPRAALSDIRILSHSEKKEWELITKYDIGSKRG